MDFVPENEQGVVLLWGAVCHLGGWSPVWIRTAFPDGCFEKDGKKYLIEFEYLSSNFMQHGHDVTKCDLIVCWKNNLTDDMPVRIIELSDPDWYVDDFSAYTTEEMFRMAAKMYARNKKIKKKMASLMRELDGMFPESEDSDDDNDQMYEESSPSRKRLDFAKEVFGELLEEGETEIYNMTELAYRYDVSRQTMYNVMNDACDAGMAKKTTGGYRIIWINR